MKRQGAAPGGASGLRVCALAHECARARGVGCIVWIHTKQLPWSVFSDDGRLTSECSVDARTARNESKPAISVLHFVNTSAAPTLMEDPARSMLPRSACSATSAVAHSSAAATAPPTARAERRWAGAGGAGAADPYLAIFKVSVFGLLNWLLYKLQADECSEPFFFIAFEIMCTPNKYWDYPSLTRFPPMLYLELPHAAPIASPAALQAPSPSLVVGPVTIE